MSIPSTSTPSTQNPAAPTNLTTPVKRQQDPSCPNAPKKRRPEESMASLLMKANHEHELVTQERDSAEEELIELRHKYLESLNELKKIKEAYEKLHNSVYPSGSVFFTNDVIEDGVESVSIGSVDDGCIHTFRGVRCGARCSSILINNFTNLFLCEHHFKTSYIRSLAKVSEEEAERSLQLFRQAKYDEQNIAKRLLERAQVLNTNDSLRLQIQKIQQERQQRQLMLLPNREKPSKQLLLLARPVAK